MNSPLGKYSQFVAAIVVVGIIASYVAALFLGLSSAEDQLRDFAFMAIGAVLGSAAAVNGVKPSIEAAHTRLDKIGVPSAGDISHPTSATIVTETTLKPPNP